MSQRYAKITGWGKYVPEHVVTNDDLARIVDTSDEWIRTRTGIRERRLRTENDTTASMSVEARTVTPVGSIFSRRRNHARRRGSDHRRVVYARLSAALGCQPGAGYVGR